MMGGKVSLIGTFLGASIMGVLNNVLLLKYGNGCHSKLLTKTQPELPCATGQANSQYRQGLTTSLGSSIPMIEPSIISESASRLSFSFLQ